MKTITFYSKTEKCYACKMTRKKLVDLGVARFTDASESAIESNIDGLTINTIYIDDPANFAVLEKLKTQGLLQAPVVMTDFPVSTAATEVAFSGFNPPALNEIAQALKG